MKKAKQKDQTLNYLNDWLNDIAMFDTERVQLKSLSALKRQHGLKTMFFFSCCMSFDYTLDLKHDASSDVTPREIEEKKTSNAAVERHKNTRRTFKQIEWTIINQSVSVINVWSLHKMCFILCYHVRLFNCW